METISKSDNQLFSNLPCNRTWEESGCPFLLGKGGGFAVRFKNMN
jgi:hypothetical protein